MMALGFLLSCFLIAFPDFLSLIPEFGVVSRIEGIVENNPKAIALGLITMMVLLPLVAIFSSYFSRRSAHKKLIAEYLTKPTPFPFSNQETDEVDSKSATRK